MTFIYSIYFIAAIISLGNSLESTKNQLPSKERFHFFDAELLQVFNQKPNSNVLISPMSIKLVLGMLAEGAEGETAGEIRAALRLPDEKDERRKEFTKWLFLLQANHSPNILKLANRVFLSTRHPVDPAYEQTLTKFYSGGVTSVKFENGKETCRVINTWVGNQTSQLIGSLVEEGQMSPDSKLVLASVVYFKGLWSSPFASERTTVRCFYVKADKCVDSLMMKETGYFDYGYVSRLDAKAIVLPYKEKKFSMLVLLPTKKDGLRLLTRDLLHVGLDSVLSELKEQEVFVQIPQFEITHNDDLLETLKTVQISQVFTPGANLSKILAAPHDSIAVGHVYHSAKIIVNEAGSEAAAATGALFVPLMGGTSTAFVANHPFLFFVLSTADNSILFAGKVVTPQAPEGVKRSSPIPSGLSEETVKRNHLQDKLFSPRKPNASQTNGNGETKRGQQSGPKFRSIQPGFPRERKISQFESSPSHRSFPSQPGSVFEKENHKKRGKIVQEGSKNRKRQESDDWRHHVLFFT